MNTTSAHMQHWSHSVSGGLYVCNATSPEGLGRLVRTSGICNQMKRGPRFDHGAMDWVFDGSSGLFRNFTQAMGQDRGCLIKIQIGHIKRLVS